MELYPNIDLFKPRASGRKGDIINNLLVIAEQMMDSSSLQGNTRDGCEPNKAVAQNKCKRKKLARDIKHRNDSESEDFMGEFEESSQNDSDEDCDSSDELEDNDLEIDPISSKNDLPAEVSVKSTVLVDDNINHHSIYTIGSGDILDTDQSQVDADDVMDYNQNLALNLKDGIDCETRLIKNCDRVESEIEETYIEFSDDDNNDGNDDDQRIGNDSIQMATVEEDVIKSKINFFHNISRLSPLQALRIYLGYSEFRKGQEWAVMRTLSGERSLLVAATGMGKSLCYMLPALMLPGITIVVSPLVSLMEDQAGKLPPELPAMVLRGATTTMMASEIVNRVMNEQIKVLFVSPERLCSGSFKRLLNLLRSKVRHNSSLSNGMQSQVVSLLCVDEAHCLSQWSYNFRPAFLSIKKAISWLDPYSILALTATASPTVQQEISCHLGVDTLIGIQSSCCKRDNLFLHAKCVNNDDDKYQVCLRGVDLFCIVYVYKYCLHAVYNSIYIPVYTI
jgi:DEAD/DEAH box helicase